MSQKFHGIFGKSKNISNDTKTYIGNNSVQHNLDIQQTDQRNCWHLRCTVTKGSYVSVGQTKKTVKYVEKLIIEKDLL